MSTHRGTPQTTDKPALIVYKPSWSGGFWDAEASRLSERLEDELDTFVTCCGPGAGSPDLDDAAAAARFVGCSSMVVVASEDSTPPAELIETAAGRLPGPFVAVGAGMPAAEVAEAYRAACARAGAAA